MYRVFARWLLFDIEILYHLGYIIVIFVYKTVPVNNFWRCIFCKSYQLPPTSYNLIDYFIWSISQQIRCPNSPIRPYRTNIIFYSWSDLIKWLFIVISHNHNILPILFIMTYKIVIRVTYQGWLQWHGKGGGQSHNFQTISMFFFL